MCHFYQKALITIEYKCRFFTFCSKYIYIYIYINPELGISPALLLTSLLLLYSYINVCFTSLLTLLLHSTSFYVILLPSGSLCSLNGCYRAGLRNFQSLSIPALVVSRFDSAASPP